MIITKVETIALRDKSDGKVTSWNPSFSESQNSQSINGAYDITLVRVHTDEGISGIGQCEAPSLVIDAIIRSSQGLELLIVGEDPGGKLTIAKQHDVIIIGMSGISSRFWTLQTWDEIKIPKPFSTIHIRFFREYVGEKDVAVFNNYLNNNQEKTDRLVGVAN
mgnify:CR=1 FL=1